MKLTFPRIGDSHIYGRLLFMELGINLVVPPLNSYEGLEKGASVSPEDMCLPFKLMVDNLMSAWEIGADTVVMPATMGPCRLGQYGELLKVILKSRGLNYHWILLDAMSAIGPKELSCRLKNIVQGSQCAAKDIFSALATTYKLIKGFESFEAEARIKSAYEKNSGETKGILRKCRQELEEATDIREGIEIVRAHRKRLRNVEADSSADPINILLTGEIFTLIDPFANHYIEESLMDLGVAFRKNISIGWWIRNNILNPFGGIMSERRGNIYLPYRIGGYAKETINDVLDYGRHGYDGVIQVFPAGCMPEIVAKSVLQGLSRDKNLPVLSIIYDEMGGDVGYLTRIEAFTDMLKRKRGKRNVLSGN